MNQVIQSNYFPNKDYNTSLCRIFYNCVFIEVLMTCFPTVLPSPHHTLFKIVLSNFSLYL